VYSAGPTTGGSSVRSVGDAVLRANAELATTKAALAASRQPDLIGDLDDSARIASLQDSQLQLSYLAAALLADSPALFLDYVRWAKVALSSRGRRTDELSSNLVCLCDALRFELPQASAEVAIAVVRDTIAQLPSLPDDIPRAIGAGQPLALLARMYLQALIGGDLRAARRLILGAIEDGITVGDVYLNVLQPALIEIGRLWQLNQLGVAREHYCTAISQMIMSVLHQHLQSEQSRSAHAVVATCVAGDQHEIGIRMVADFFEMAGWDSYFLGANTPTDAVIGEVIERDARVLAVSTTMAYHIPRLAELIRAVRRTAECEGVKILVGGHPFRLDADLWLTVDADGEASDAQHAVERTQAWFDA
jgi:methanogenic corrinoid protein MtbC1